jgi:hypothetical protein
MEIVTRDSQVLNMSIVASKNYLFLKLYVNAFIQYCIILNGIPTKSLINLVGPAQFPTNLILFTGQMQGRSKNKYALDISSYQNALYPKYHCFTAIYIFRFLQVLELTCGQTLILWKSTILVYHRIA